MRGRSDGRRGRLGTPKSGRARGRNNGKNGVWRGHWAIRHCCAVFRGRNNGERQGDGRLRDRYFLIASTLMAMFTTSPTAPGSLVMP